MKKGTYFSPYCYLGLYIVNIYTKVGEFWRIKGYYIDRNRNIYSKINKVKVDNIFDKKNMEEKS